MKQFFLVLLIAACGGFLSCDKVGQPSIIITDLDTNLFPGNFIDFEYPTFESNSNTLRNVLIEDFTGHKCGFCPPAATLAKTLEENNPGRVFVSSIHASPSPGGVSSFQQVSTSGNKYTRDFTTPEGREIAEYLSKGNALPNPIGTVNRVTTDNSEILLSAAIWSELTDSLLQLPLKVNIQAESNYYPGTGGIFIHTEVEPLVELNGEYAIAIYAAQNKIVDWQLFGNDNLEFYEHHNVHLGNVFSGESFGRVFVNGEVVAGQKFNQTVSYKLPDGLDGNSMHFQIYVYDKQTEEILQVIEHRF